jgi:hypothetical protein
MISTTETNMNYLTDSSLEKKYFKFPFLACEIIMCGIKRINEKILKVDLLKKYFSFLEEREKVKNQINSCSDYYFTKTLKHFLKNNYVEITNFLMEQGDLKRFISNVDIFDFDDTLLSLLGLSEKEKLKSSDMTEEKLRELFVFSKKNDLNENLKEQIRKVQDWSIENNFLSNLILELKNDNLDVHSNVFKMLENILNKSPNSKLSEMIKSNDFISSIFKILFEFNFVTLFKYSNQFFKSFIKIALDEEEESIGESIASHTSSYVDVLLIKNENVILSTFGEIHSFGELKLEMIEFLLNVHFFITNIL